MNSRFDPKNDARPLHPNPLGSPVEEPMSPTEARQGRKGSPVLMVLIAGIVLALLAWGAAEWWGEASDAPDQQTATPPAADNAPASSAAPQGGDTAPATPPAPPSSSNP